MTEKIEGMTVEGDGLQSDERELQGRKLVLYRGPGRRRAAPSRCAVRPAARRSHVALPRVGAGAGAAPGFGVYAAAAAAAARARERLETQREQLLGELAALEKTAVNDKRDKRDKKRRS